MRALLSCTALLSLPLLTACPAIDKPVDCTLEARASIQVTVVDAGGATVDDAEVFFGAEGAAEEACERIVDDWVCGWEQAGTFEVVARAPGSSEASQVVEVSSDECHVITEQVELVLEPLDCTAEEVPALLVDVRDDEGGLLPDAEVFVEVEGFEEPLACEKAGEQWACAYELSGAMTAVVAHFGYLNAEADFDVEHDGCHPVTQTWELTLQAE